MNSVNNLLLFLNENWTGILIAVGVGISLYRKIKKYLSMSNDEKIEIAKKAIKERIKKYIADAEINWEEYTKSGSIKRAEVLDEIYKEYPVLAQVVNQEDIITWIDELIDSSLTEIETIIK